MIRLMFVEMFFHDYVSRAGKNSQEKSVSLLFDLGKLSRSLFGDQRDDFIRLMYRGREKKGNVKLVSLLYDLGQVSRRSWWDFYDLFGDHRDGLTRLMCRGREKRIMKSQLTFFSTLGN